MVIVGLSQSPILAEMADLPALTVAAELNKRKVPTPGGREMARRAGHPGTRATRTSGGMSPMPNLNTFETKLACVREDDRVSHRGSRPCVILATGHPLGLFASSHQLTWAYLPSSSAR
jgi:hypothetical protein